MAKSAYIGIGGVARQVKNIYIGIGGVARRVKKGYIGIGGVARLFFVASKILRAGPTSTMSTPRYEGGSASAGNYALFAGGRTSNSDSSTTVSTVMVINDSLVQSSGTSLNMAARDVQGCPFAGNAVFIGGVNSAASAHPSYDDWYSSTLTHSTASRSSSYRCYYPLIAANSQRIVSAGGRSYNDSNGILITARSHNTSRTATTLTSLTHRRMCGGGASVNDNIILVGGWDNTGFNNPTGYVDVYNSSFTHSTLTEITPKGYCSGGATEKYAFFSPSNVSSPTDVRALVDVFNSSLTHSTLTLISVTGLTLGHALCTLDNKVIISGSSSSYLHYIDDSLTVSRGIAQQYARSAYFTAVAGKYVVYAGGNNSAQGLLTKIESFYFE